MKIAVWFLFGDRLSCLKIAELYCTELYFLTVESLFYTIIIRLKVTNIFGPFSRSYNYFNVIQMLSSHSNCNPSAYNMFVFNYYKYTCSLWHLNIIQYEQFLQCILNFVLPTSVITIIQSYCFLLQLLIWMGIRFFCEFLKMKRTATVNQS